MRYKTGKRFKTTVVILMIAAIFSFMGKVLYQNWTQVPFERLRFNYLFLFTSYFFLFLSFLLSGAGWKLILESLQENISFKNSVKIMSISQLGKYTPGKIWFTVGRMYLAKKEGIPERKTVISVILETVLLFLASLIMFSGSIGFFINRNLPLKAYLPLLFIPICFVVIHPAIFKGLVNFGLRRLKREEVEFNPKYIQILGFLFLYCFVWIFQGIGFYLLIKSFYPVQISSFLPLLGIYAIAWIIGFLSLITPGGLGIREGILSFLLKFYLPISIGIITALLARVWITIGEIVFFAIFAKDLKKYTE